MLRLCLFSAMGLWLPRYLLICSFAVKVNPALAVQANVTAGAVMQGDSDTIGTGQVYGNLPAEKKKA
jgi:hypothetical protein